jgi:O-antigen ligase
LLTGPFLANAIIASVSRSGFLALAVGGTAFAVLMPSKYRKAFLPLGVLGLVGFLWLTTDAYWSRIETIEYRGELVEGKDTGHKRLVLAQAQLKMAKRFPLGCGAFCTDVLSPQYLDEKQLNFGTDGVGRRSSHNTYLSMLVDHGVPGLAAFVLLLLWVAKSAWRLRTHTIRHHDRLALAVAALGGGFAAMFIGDLFVQYPKLEVRFWFIAILLSLLRWRQLDYLGKDNSVSAAPQLTPAGAGVGEHAGSGSLVRPART